MSAIWALFRYNVIAMQVFAVLVLVAMLGWVTALHVYDDFRLLPDAAARRLEGGTHFFPLFVSYLIAIFPIMVIEQRRQFRRYCKRMRLPKNVSIRYSERFGILSARELLLVYGLGATIALLYMVGNGLLVIENVPEGMHLRRAPLLFLPIIMWGVVLEIIVVLFRINRLVLDFEQRFAARSAAHVDDAKPLARLVLNQVGFVAIAVSLTPLLWVRVHLLWLDFTSSLILISVLYGIAMAPVLIIRARRVARDANPDLQPLEQVRRRMLTYEPSEEGTAPLFLSRFMIGEPLTRLVNLSGLVSVMLYFGPILIWISLFISQFSF